MARTFVLLVTFTGDAVPTPEAIANSTRCALAGPLNMPVAVDVVPNASVVGRTHECRIVNAYHKALANDFFTKKD